MNSLGDGLTPFFPFYLLHFHNVVVLVTSIKQLLIFFQSLEGQHVVQ